MFPETVYAYIGANKAHHEFRAGLANAKAMAFLLGKDDSSILKGFLSVAAEAREKSPDGYYAFGLGGRATPTSLQLGIHIRGNEIELMQHEPGGFPALAYALVYREVNRIFETFLIDLFVEIGRKDKRVLYSNKQISHEDALKATSPEDIQNLVIEHRKAELTRGGYVLLSKTYDAVGVPILGSPPLDDKTKSVQKRLSFMNAARNIIEHNNSIVNDEFLALVPDSGHIRGQRIIVTTVELGDALSAVEWCTDGLNRRTVEKYAV
jgi:hypothetical protein